MSTTGRSEADAPAASDVAARLRSAGFVGLTVAGTADGVAAAGLLADALEACDVPYQTSVVPLPEGANTGTDADVRIALGRPAGPEETALGDEGGSASAAAYDVAAELADPDPALALAGVIGTGRVPGSDLLDAATERRIDRRPGIASPGVDPVDALAHSTLVHAPFSGDREAAAETLAGLDRSAATDADARQQPASAVALAVAGDGAATERATVAVERFLRPLAGSPFGTVGGFGDVLAATARERPGLGVALALGSGEVETALSLWRDHGERAHAAARDASTGRYDGLYVARLSAADEHVPVGTVARLLCGYRSPEPVVLVVSNGIAEARTATVGGDVAGVPSASDPTPAVGDAMDRAAQEVDGTGGGTTVRGRATYDVTPTEFIAAFREAFR
jgi:hypothetical protein